MKTITHSLPDETVRQLDDAAAAAVRSRSNLVRTVLEDWLATQAQQRAAGDAAAADHLRAHRQLGSKE